MVLINWITISPPLLNSSCAWSSDLDQLTQLYESPFTGAVTTRSATLEGFKENEDHTVAFAIDSLTSINSYGYSPHPLSKYLEWIEQILTSHRESVKPIIISVATSQPQELELMLKDIQALRLKLHDNQTLQGHARIAVELNTSCPNIPDAVPPAYDQTTKLFPLMLILADFFLKDPTLTVGLKLPPYLMKDQYLHCMHGMAPLVVQLYGERRSTISFLTCINTVGNAMLPASLAKQPEANAPSEATLSSASEDTAVIPEREALSDRGPPNPADRFRSANLWPKPKDPSPYALPVVCGGLAGEAIHAIALGNVYTFRQLIDSDLIKSGDLHNIKIIGVGGVTSKEAVDRMKMAGADVVGCATFFGKEGVKAFEILSKTEENNLVSMDCQ